MIGMKKCALLTLTGESINKWCYPAGETQVRILPEYLDNLRDCSDVRILARIKSAQDIVEVVLLSDAARVAVTSAAVRIILPYLPYGRADRRFCAGDCYGLVTFGAMINIAHPKSIVTLDVHSDVATRVVPRLINVSPLRLIEQAISEFASFTRTSEICVLFPDEGARKRYDLSRQLTADRKILDVKILNASKKRNALTGAFEGFSVPARTDERPTLIVDDICDGGGTFVGLGGLMPKNIVMGLYVTHGIFSKGLGVLRERFSWIATTDSFSEHEPIVDLRMEALPLLLAACGESES